jgi:DNA processing protein
MKWKSKLNKELLVAFFLIPEEIISLKQKLKLYYSFNEDIEEIASLKIDYLNRFLNKRNIINELKWDELVQKASVLIQNSEDKSLKTNIKVITKYDKDYPFKIVYFNDKDYSIKPSPVLFYLGNIELFNNDENKFISIFGARNPLKISEEITKKVVKYYAKEGYVIVSGFAKGIDTIVHSETINNNGKTIAVVGCGVNIVYPAKNLNMYRKIISNDSLIISEFPLDTKPLKQNFYIRNRIISMLGNEVFFIQGSFPSGGLITANYALSFNKKVYCFYHEIEKVFDGNRILVNEKGCIPFNFFENGKIYFLKFNDNKYSGSKYKDKNDVEFLKKLLLKFLLVNGYQTFNSIQNYLNIDKRIIIRILTNLLNSKKIQISNGIYYYPFISNISSDEIILSYDNKIEN